MFGYWYNTNINFAGALTPAGDELIESLIDQVTKEYTMVVERRFFDDTPQIIYQEWIDNFNDVTGLDLYQAVVFARSPNLTVPGVHIDDNRDRKRPVAAVNWVYGIDDSDMVWYKMDGQALVQSYEHGVIHSAFNKDEMSTFEEVERKTIGNTNMLTLVRVDVPHDIVPHDGNSRQNARIGFTMRFRNEFDSWDDVVSQLQSKGVI